MVRDLLARCHAYRDYQPAEELALERDKAKAEEILMASIKRYGNKSEG